MEKWKPVRLPNNFVRYVHEGCVELGRRLQQEPRLAEQIEAVIQEQVSRTPMEALEIENGLSILTGPDIARAVMGCLRFLESFEEVEDLRGQGYEDEMISFIRYLVARYGPVLKAVRRRMNHPLGWHKFGHSINRMETGSLHLHFKLLRNDDEEFLLEDDTESILRLINLMLKAVEQADDYQSLDEETIQEFIERYETLLERTADAGALGGNGTEH